MGGATDPLPALAAALNSVPKESAPRAEFFKDALARGDRYLTQRFEAGAPVEEVIAQRGQLMDQLLAAAWRAHLPDAGNAALVAVGGYGRGDLQPGSDIDLTLLATPRSRSQLKSSIETFLAFLWDLGLALGHSVRTPKECLSEARADVTVATNLMESRLLAGKEDLHRAMLRLTGPNKVWPSRKFFEAKQAEQAQRHRKYDNNEHNLEPNVKEGPGGLRDVQTVEWVAKRHFGATGLKDLARHGFLTRAECHALESGRNFLRRVRYTLHLAAGRGEDRLLFDYQKQVARKFGCRGRNNAGVEKFMKSYYQTAKEISRLNEMLLQHFQEEIIYARRREKIRPLNKRFQIRNDFIEAKNRGVFKRYPFALLEIFLLLQQNPGIKGVRASTVRLIRESLVLIDDRFRKDIRSQSLFLEIIRQPRRVGHELQRMHKYGVLGAYLPEFAMIEGLMQFDLFHVYTVDEHILFVIRNLRRFGLDEYASRFPLCHHILREIPKQELLYLAGLFHDMAKGRGGDHSGLGAEAAQQFCKRHHLSDYDARLVAWLVQEHLLMSKTAQKEDLNDPEVVKAFAQKVGDATRLNYLYALTVADINGTNPQLWNSWKAALLAELHAKTASALRRGLENPIDKEALVREAKAQALASLKQGGGGEADIEAAWARLSDDYFIRHRPDEIAWHTQAVLKNGKAPLPLILLRDSAKGGATELFIYMRDHDNIFSRSVQTLDLLRLNIVDARIMSSADGHTLDTFIVLEQSGAAVKGRERKKEIRETLKSNLSVLDRPVKRVRQVGADKFKHFTVPIRVAFSVDETNRRTVMEVSATDRPGFLSSIGSALELCGMRLQAAKIATYGERIEDTFYITDRDNQIIADAARQAWLSDAITQALKAR